MVNINEMAKFQLYNEQILYVVSISVNVNIVDEEQKSSIQSYDPHAPITRKGVLRSLITGRPIEIREEDVVCDHSYFVVVLTSVCF